MTILVFPSCLEAAVRFADEAHRWRQRVVGASSLDVDPYALRYDAWEKLPYIGEDGFFGALSALVRRQNIDSIFTPHAPSFNLLEAKLPSLLPHVAILGEGPYKTHVKQIENALAQAEHDLMEIAGFGIAAGPLPIQFIAGLLLQMDRFYGQCAREKALAICAIMPSAVKGDVIEIGSLFGKSTYIFNRLASYCGVGGTLAIDPWRLEVSIQHDAAPNIQDAPRKWNWEMVYQGFLVNMLGCACPPFNYMKTTSADAYARYSANPEVTTPEFGSTIFGGSIAVLHIDGNHDEVAVAEDFNLWSKRLAPGAWVVFDDYNWPHGDGPRKVADRAVSEFGDRVQRRFLAGGAFFMQIDG
jgi:SAM-dependent methyltransferase